MGIDSARLRKRASYGSANTNTFAALLGFSSGVTRLSDPATSDGPVVTATYCLPSTANVTGIAADRRAEIHFPQHLAVAIVERAEASVGVAAEHQPAAVATSDSAPARCSCFHTVLPVSAEIAHTRADVVARPARCTPGMSRP